MTIAILGAGAMAGLFVKTCTTKGISLTSQIVRQGKERANMGMIQLFSVDDLPANTRLLVDCAGHEGLIEHGPAALRRGIDVLTISIGALADPSIFKMLESAAEEGGSTLQLASGAIGGLDVLRAAAIEKIDKVTYRGRKPPEGWRGSRAEDFLDLSSLHNHAVTHFKGTAREAALAYPKNTNVAAAVAIAGIGMDETIVELIADPNALGNTHEIEATGSFGTMTFSIMCFGLPENPRSSALAALSMVAAILERQSAVRF